MLITQNASQETKGQNVSQLQFEELQKKYNGFLMSRIEDMEINRELIGEKVNKLLKLDHVSERRISDLDNNSAFHSDSNASLVIKSKIEDLEQKFLEFKTQLPSDLNTLKIICENYKEGSGRLNSKFTNVESSKSRKVLFRNQM